MTKQENEILEATKEFAEHHKIPYDERIESMILNAMREVVKNCSIPNVVKPKGTFCQTPDSCQISYYQQIGNYYCSKCEKTGLT